MTTFGRPIALLLLVIGTIGCDRVTKQLATESLAGTPTQSFFADTVRLTYAENPGGFLSLGAAMSPGLRTAVFSVATGAMLVVLAFVGWRQRNRAWHAAALALFIAGGASNWVDRFNHGHVVDFLNVGIGWLRTGVFNVADAAIMLGAGLDLVAELRAKSARP